MTRKSNYDVQVERAQARFLGYDQDALPGRHRLESDKSFIYAKMLCKQYRLSRTTGKLQRLEGAWVDANSHSEVMTLLDFLCDSRVDRFLSGKWTNMSVFGLRFHQAMLESGDSLAEAIQADMPGFCRACTQMDGTPMPGADLCYAVELFDGLRIAIQFWEGDEDFPPRVRYLWDENALMYLKYETMHYALELLRSRILGIMEEKSPTSA